MSDPPSPRIAYIRTVLDPNKNYESIYRFLHHSVRQSSNEQISTGQPRHRFIFGAFNASDSQILDILVGSFAPQSSSFWYLEKGDLELRMSESSAATNAGKRILSRCKAGDILSKVCGSDDEECDRLMLEESDYLIDDMSAYDTTWFFDHVRPGIPQDNMLTNPVYDVSRHDFSGLANRIKFCVWSRNSGCFHGNDDWSCRGCGGKCKRGRCRVNPSPDKPVRESERLPPSGSARWRDLTAEDVCQLFCTQTRAGAHPERDDWRSINTFSGI